MKIGGQCSLSVCCSDRIGDVGGAARRARGRRRHAAVQVLTAVPERRVPHLLLGANHGRARQRGHREHTTAN